MAEKINDKTIFTLLEVTLSIKKALATRYSSAFWIKAEMNKLNYYAHSGHCYPDLVEKKEGKVIAQLKANLWKDDYTSVNARFIQMLHEPLKDGIKILFSARITYDPVHGIALRIIDIDPSYTLGDLEREKQETITRLRVEGLFTRNKTLSLPILPQRVAIISVDTSKGYADFLKVIDHNPWGYQFFHLLFPALLQGEKAIDSIIYQLRRIKKVKDHFDVVAIIRGGGGDVGLSCYNDYLLSKEIALFPIPVITGIGHATNETIAEMIAFQNAITPTKIAEYLIQKFHNFSVPVQKAQEKITDISKRVLQEEKNKLLNTTRYFCSVTSNQLIINNNEINKRISSLFQFTRFVFRKEKEVYTTILNMLKKDILAQLFQVNSSISQFILKFEKGAQTIMFNNKQILWQSINKLQQGTILFQKDRSMEIKNLEININNMDPKNVLKRGYSITVFNGQAINGVKSIKAGDTLKTILIDGSINSSVNSTEKLSDQ